MCPAGGVPSTGPAAEATQWLVPPPALSQSRRGLWVSVCPDRASWTLWVPSSTVGVPKGLRCLATSFTRCVRWPLGCLSTCVLRLSGPVTCPSVRHGHSCTHAFMLPLPSPVCT